MRVRHAAAAFAVVAMITGLASPAFADPTGSKNSLTIAANCPGLKPFNVVVNSANGQGSGAQNHTTAEFSPAHVIGTNQVFHPVAFDLTFTFTPTGGSPQSFTDTSSRPNQTATTTCNINAAQSAPDGSFTLTGTVAGWFS